MTTLADLERVERELREYVAILESPLYDQPDRASWVENKADTIAAYIAAQRERDAATGWQPMSTCPDSGELVMIYSEGRYYVCRADDYHAKPYWLKNATGWMPIPAAPSGTEKENGDG